MDGSSTFPRPLLPQVLTCALSLDRMRYDRIRSGVAILGGTCLRLGGDSLTVEDLARLLVTVMLGNIK